MTKRKRPAAITVKLGPEWREALEYFQKNGEQHISPQEQISRALICYWTGQPLPHGAKAMCMAMDDYVESVALETT